MRRGRILSVVVDFGQGGEWAVKIIAKFRYGGKQLAIVELNSGATVTMQANAQQWVGDSAATLRAAPQERYTPVVPGARIETPVAQQSMESNVKVPLAQAIIESCIVGSAVFCAAAGIVTFFGLPKPAILTIALTAVATLRTMYESWRGNVNMADSLLTRIEDFTNIDWNRDGQTGSQKAPPPQLRFVKVGGYGTTDNPEPYRPQSTEQHINIPGMPRLDVDPWTVERLVDVLERAFVSGRWSRANCNELGMSQGQWAALSQWLGPGEDGKGWNIWGAQDHLTLQAFVDQIRETANQPTG
jgi:hypothetical protein